MTGRIDDMLNVSGHLLSTSEVESALVEHRSVAEAAVVAHPHDIKGEALYCFITLIEVRLTAAGRSVFVVRFSSYRQCGMSRKPVLFTASLPLN